MLNGIYNKILSVLLVFFTMTTVSHANQDYSSIPEDQTATVIYTYFQIDENAFPEASLNLETFKSHIESIENEGIKVVHPSELMQKKTDDAPRIMITFDTGHVSILDNAIPLLLEKEIPFTIFISPSEIDQNLPYVIKWPQLKKLYRNKLVTIGIHTGHYKKYTEFNAYEDVETSIRSSISRYKDVFGKLPEYFAYPYGDHELRIADFLSKNGIRAAFGLHSGVAYERYNKMNLPRFTMTDTLGSTERFINVAYNLPLPITDLVPESTVLKSLSGSLSYTVLENIKNKAPKIQCFHSGNGKLDTTIIGKERVHIKMSDTISTPSRIRVNCTLRAGYDPITERNLWRWHGMLYRVVN